MRYVKFQFFFLAKMNWKYRNTMIFLEISKYNNLSGMSYVKNFQPIVGSIILLPFHSISLDINSNVKFNILCCRC